MTCPCCGRRLPTITQRTPWHARRRAQLLIGLHSGELARRLALEYEEEEEES